MALEDIADIFGDGIVLTDEREEAVHRKFKEAGYRAEVLDDVHHEDILEGGHADDKYLGTAVQIEHKSV